MEMNRPAPSELVATLSILLPNSTFTPLRVPICGVGRFARTVAKPVVLLLGCAAVTIRGGEWQDRPYRFGLVFAPAIAEYGAIRPQTHVSMNTLYNDKLIELTDRGMVFHHYYFPFGDKQVSFDQIEHVETRPPSLSNGSWRAWGTGDLRTWFPLDIKRPSRDLIFFASLRDSKRCIGFTVENSSRVKAILDERGLLQDARPA